MLDQPPSAGASAYIALLIYPLVIMVFFKWMPLQKVLIWSIIGGYLFLPAAWVVNFDLPLLPPLDKNLIPPLVAGILAIVSVARIKKKLRMMRDNKPVARAMPNIQPGLLPRSFIGLGLLTLMIFGGVMTILTNQDYLLYGDLYLPGQRPSDALSGIFSMIVVILPLLLGRKFLANDTGHRMLLVAMCIAALIYSLLALYEVRMSPQLNNMVYGFFPHSWVQHIRAGGFRPLVFLDHGLHWGIYLACTIIAVATLSRMASEGSERFRYIGIMIYLLGVLFLSKTLGAMIIAMLLLPVALFLPVRVQLMVAAIIAGITLAYPMLRGAGFVPTQQLIDLAQNIDTDRAGSLQYRFDNEDVLLGQANERPLFGWSGYGRWRVYDEFGNDLTVSDGEWIITIGRYGWIGYIAKFGLLCIPLILFALRQKRYQIGLASAGLCVVVAANLIDLLPNAAPSPVLWMIAGALLGRIEHERGLNPAQEDEIASAPLPKLRRRGAELDDLVATPYSRFPHRIQR